MGFWFWFGIFAAIALLALISYALIGLRVASKAQALQEPAARLQALATKLEQAAVLVPATETLFAALDTDELVVAQRRKAVLKHRSERKQAKQRRLITRLRNMEIDESRVQKDA
jgi:hypothetical protein